MPGISPFLVLLGLILAQSTDSAIDAIREGHYQDARGTLEKVLAKDPADSSARSFLAITKAAQGDCVDAEADFAQSPSASFGRMIGLAAVQCEAAAGLEQKSFNTLDELEKRYPADPDVLYELANLHRKAWDRAVRHLYERTPDSYRVNQISAEVFETEGKFSEAAAQYRTAIEKAPKALNLHYRLGRSLLLAGNGDENLNQARMAFATELTLNPNDAVAVYQIGQILNVQQRPAEAVAQFEHAIELRADFPEALLAVGKARAKEKRLEDAAALFQRVLVLHPENEAAHYNLMLAYRDLGRTAEAAQQKQELDRLQKPPEGEFSQFLNKLGEKAPPR